MDNKVNKSHHGRLAGNPFQELVKYMRSHHNGEDQHRALAREVHRARECHEVHADLETARTKMEQPEKGRPRSPESTIDKDERHHKYTNFQVSLKVHHPVASHRFLVDAFRDTNVVVSERDERERFSISLSCGAGKTTIVNIIERDPDEVFSIAPKTQMMDHVCIEMHLASNSLDAVRVNLARHGHQTFDKNLSKTVMFRDLEYVGDTPDLHLAYHPIFYYASLFKVLTEHHR